MESIWLMFKGIGKGVLYTAALFLVYWLLLGMPDIHTIENANLGCLFGFGALIKYFCDREFLMNELKHKK